MPRFCLALCIGMVIVIGNSGCNPPAKGAAKTQPVKGKVFIDNRPMPDGEISFEIMGFPPSSIPIKDGEFSGTAPEGKNRVRISKFEKVTPKKDEPEPPPRNLIPPQWNNESKLEATVGTGTNDLKFEITSK